MNSVKSPLERLYWCAMFDYFSLIYDAEVAVNNNVPIGNIEKLLSVSKPIRREYPNLPDEINDIKQFYPAKPFDFKVTNATGLNKNGSARKPIHWYETIKIRKCLRAIETLEGYPIKNFHRADFYGFLMLGVPSTHFIDHAATYQHWWDNTADRWRSVIIKRFQYESQEENLFYDFLSAIPVFGGLIGMITKGIVPAVSVEELPIFENLISYRYVNDKIIMANWDKVRAVLNEHGY
jgi:hypothetical protein